MKKAIVVLLLGLVTLIAIILFTNKPGPEPKKLSQAEFLTKLQSNVLTKVRIYYPAKLGQVDGVTETFNEVRGTFGQANHVDPGSEAKGLSSELAFVASVHLTPELEANLLGRPNTSVVEPNPFAQKAREWLVRSK